MSDLTEPQRQSPLAIVFFGIKLVRRIGIVQVAIGLLFLWNTVLAGSLALVALLVAAVLAVFGIMSWWRFTFQVVDGEMIVRSGVLRADRLTVPIERIQSVSIEQQLLHRALGLVTVSVDTAGSDAAEFEIAAITRTVAEALERETVTVGSTLNVDDPHAAAVADQPPDAVEVVVAHDWRRLVLWAITTWPISGLVLLAPFFAFADEIGEYLFGKPLDEFVDTPLSLWWVPVIVVSVSLGIVGLNVIRVLLTDWSLTLSAGPRRVQRTSGLLSRTSRSSSVERIQMVSSRQNLLQRRAGLRSITLSTIGEGDIVLNGCDATEHDDVRRRVHVATETPGDHDRRVHPFTAWPPVRNSLCAVAVLVAIGWFVLDAWALLAIVVLVPYWLVARQRVANTRWSVSDELATRHHLVSAALDQAPLFKANAVVVTQSIFERRHGLAQVRIDTAAGSVSVGMIPLPEARAVRDVALREAETDPRPFM